MAEWTVETEETEKALFCDPWRTYQAEEMDLVGNLEKQTPSPEHSLLYPAKDKPSP